MTSKERAEKIAERLDGKAWMEEDFEWIATQISKAEREAREESIRACSNSVLVQVNKEQAYAEGFSAAREKAKGIVLIHRSTDHNVQHFCIDMITDRIAAMQPDGEIK